LLVGALSWNPERIRSLADRGHQLWGLWARSMGWDQGPYPALDDVVERITIDDAARTIRDQQIECVYALFQVYDASLWAPVADGVDVGVWTVLRALLDERARGHIDVPFVFHWGFDVHTLDGPVVRALDGHIFCNAELPTYWTTPVAEGGCGLDLWKGAAVRAVLDGDRPKLEFMNDDFTPPLSAQTGEVHTVCIGRPFNIDAQALADRRIHLHVYGNGFDDVTRTLAEGALRSGSVRDGERLRAFVHVHRSRQPAGAAWAEVQATKAQWVAEFSRYDAGWSYVGTPFPWSTLEDRAAIPNRLSTYLLAGLPVIADRRPGFYRYEEMRRLGVGIDLVDRDYDGLAARLAREVETRARRHRARASRRAYSFDASIHELIAVLEESRRRYLARPLTKRRRGLDDDGQPLIRLAGNPASGWRRWAPRRVARRLRAETVGRVDNQRVRRLARDLFAGTGRP
jgi:hypothetical protein